MWNCIKLDDFTSYGQFYTYVGVVYLESFRDREDFEVYLAQLEENIKYYKNEYDIVCYCLMDNHVHLLLHTYDKHINYFMKRINSIYPRYFNNKYNYCGHLYEKRYFSEIGVVIPCILATKKKSLLIHL